MTDISLRPYQSAAIDQMRQIMRSGKKRVVAVAPTGAGKTIIASRLIQGAVAKNHQALFVAPRRELVDQASAKLDAVGIAHGIIMADHHRVQPWQTVQVASVPTLARRLEKTPLQPSLIILDECHHATAASYQAILDNWPEAYVIGLTATPERSDGRGLGEIFEELVEVAKIRDLIDQGYLVPPRVWAPEKLDLSGLRVSRGDYDERQLADLMNQPKLVGNLVSTWQKLGQGVTTVCFAVSVAHSQTITRAFTDAGIRAAHLDGETPTPERERILRDLASGVLQVVANVMVLTEGWDMPRAACCIMARPTMSTGLFLQMAGRVLRTHPGKAEARILDHAGLVYSHGLPDQNREWSLEAPRRTRKGEKVLAVTRCESCFAVMLAGTKTCPQCGFERAGVEGRSDPRHDEQGEMAEVHHVDPEAQKMNKARLLKARFEAQAKAKGYKPGWVTHRLAAIVGPKIAYAIAPRESAE
ncbi:MAG: DEAD/DEAH box helicase [Magnetococcales bacterium]|nr:DEAD/DEAH box helicase [Magnetococcales bacterium]